MVSTVDVLGSFLRLMKGIQTESSIEYRNIKTEIDGCNFVLLEGNIETINVGTRYWIWVRKLESEGLTPYFLLKNMSQWTAKIEAKIDQHNIITAQVILQNKRNRNLIVGRFPTMEEAERWYNLYYRDGVVERIFFKDREEFSLDL